MKKWICKERLLNTCNRSDCRGVRIQLCHCNCCEREMEMSKLYGKENVNPCLVNPKEAEEYVEWVEIDESV